nr:hypothetical protein KitaXyl93_23440 [Kitasatospora sp. Xyl93]
MLTRFAGDETVLFTTQTINDTVDGAYGRFVWLVPPDLQPGPYALGLGPRLGAGNSDLFEVAAGGGTAPSHGRGRWSGLADARLFAGSAAVRRPGRRRCGRAADLGLVRGSPPTCTTDS